MSTESESAVVDADKLLRIAKAKQKESAHDVWDAAKGHMKDAEDKD